MTSGSLDAGVPFSWRIVSLTALLSAVALGIVVVLAAPLLLVAALCLAFAAITLALAPASRRPPLSPLDDGAIARLGALPFLTVVIAGRDEASVLPHLLGDLGAQDHRDADGGPGFEVIVIDDRSTDGTGEVALEAAARAGIGEVTRVVRRGPPPGVTPDPALPPLPDGKGAALSATGPADYAGVAVVVLDADARIGPEFLRRAATYFARGAGAMTAHRRILQHDAGSWLARQLQAAEADEETVDGEINCGRWGQGGCSEFRGNGIMVRTDLLAAVGGWHAHALCEDLDLSTRLATLGTRVGWAVDAVAWEEPVTGVQSLRRQRLRWGEGIIRRELELTLPLLASRRLPIWAKVDYLAYSAQTLLPVLLTSALVAGVVIGSWPIVGMLFATYLIPGGLLAADSLRFDGLGGAGRIPERLARGLRVLVFSGLWIPVFAVCWPRVAFGSGPVRYAKTEHVGAPEGFRPGGAASGGTAPDGAARPRQGS